MSTISDIMSYHGGKHRVLADAAGCIYLVSGSYTRTLTKLCKPATRDRLYKIAHDGLVALEDEVANVNGWVCDTHFTLDSTEDYCTFRMTAPDMEPVDIKNSEDNIRALLEEIITLASTPGVTRPTNTKQVSVSRNNFGDIISHHQYEYSSGITFVSTFQNIPFARALAINVTNNLVINGNELVVTYDDEKNEPFVSITAGKALPMSLDVWKGVVRMLCVEAHEARIADMLMNIGNVVKTAESEELAVRSEQEPESKLQKVKTGSKRTGSHPQLA